MEMELNSAAFCDDLASKFVIEYTSYLFGANNIFIIQIFAWTVGAVL